MCTHWNCAHDEVWGGGERYWGVPTPTCGWTKLFCGACEWIQEWSVNRALKWGLSIGIWDGGCSVHSWQWTYLLKVEIYVDRTKGWYSTDIFRYTLLLPFEKCVKSPSESVWSMVAFLESDIKVTHKDGFPFASLFLSYLISVSVNSCQQWFLYQLYPATANCLPTPTPHNTFYIKAFAYV